MNIRNIIIALVAAVVLNVLVVATLSSVIVERALQEELRNYMPLGSSGANYSSRNITSTNASSTAGVLIRSNGGTLGTITIASSSPATLVRIYDGGTTATSSATLLGTLQADGDEQTFHFDIAVRNGLVLDVPATFNGSLIITHR